MTVQQIVDEINFIEKNIKEYQTIIASDAAKEIKAEYREKLVEDRHQLMHLKSILTAIKYDPLF